MICKNGQTIKSITLQFDITSTLKTVHLRHDLSDGLKFNSIINSISKTFFIVDELSLPASWPLQHFLPSIFQDEKDKPKITKKQNYVVFRHKPKEKSKSKSKDEKERIQIESESSDEETQSFLHRSTKESSFLNRFLKTSENLEEKGPVLCQKSTKKDR